ncbi:MAG: thermonuclease family protein [Bacteroidales bacterium]
MTKLMLSIFTLLFTWTYTCNQEVSDEQSASAENIITGKVIAIIDGDTYDILTDDTVKFRIRMEGIDAPERGMPYYRVSKDYLGALCFGQRVSLHHSGKDRNGRILGFAYLEDGRELSREMIMAGMAWHFKQYNQDPALDSLEIEARNRKVGLWADPHPKAPWDYRKEKRNQNNQKKQ